MAVVGDSGESAVTSTPEAVGLADAQEDLRIAEQNLDAAARRLDAAEAEYTKCLQVMRKAAQVVLGKKGV